MRSAATHEFGPTVSKANLYQMGLLGLGHESGLAEGDVLSLNLVSGLHLLGSSGMLVVLSNAGTQLLNGVSASCLVVSLRLVSLVGLLVRLLSTRLLVRFPLLSVSDSSGHG